MAKKIIDIKDVNYNTKHKIEVDSGDLPSPDIDAEQLLNVLEGSETVVVDLAEDNEHVEVHLDAEVLAKVENSLQLPITPPVKNALVGVGTNGAQKSVGIGNGLDLTGNALNISPLSSQVEIYNVTEDMWDEDSSQYVLLVDDLPAGISSVNASNLQHSEASVRIIFSESSANTYAILFTKGFYDAPDALWSFNYGVEETGADVTLEVGRTYTLAKFGPIIVVGFNVEEL